MKLALGTVQFGLSYGVSNKDGMTPLPEVRRILELASQRGVDTLDTASLYGESEAVLGEASDLTQRFRIVTKTPAFGGGQVTDALHILDAAFEKSLSSLRRRCVDGLLFHHASDLFNGDGASLYARLSEYKRDGLVGKIGASLYTSAEALKLLDHYDLDIVQIPMSILDRRLLESGILDRLDKAGIEIHVRSAFLQGLLFMEPARIPERLASARSVVKRVQERAASARVSLPAFAVAFLDSLPQVDRIVVGVNNVAQLSQLLADEQLQLDEHLFDGLACNDESILNPTRWDG